jgi:hypothetical protein
MKYLFAIFMILFQGLSAEFSSFLDSGVRYVLSTVFLTERNLTVHRNCS